MSHTPGTLEAVEEHLLTAIADLVPGNGPLRGPAREETVEVFRAQSQSRLCDLAARKLRGEGKGYYTIGSSGHEGNAWVAHALRVDDPALLHYRSGGFYCRRAGQHGAIDPVEDMLLGMLASTREPIAGGRHKVFGRKELEVLPQTSTIASHLPRAVGLALTLGRPRRNGIALSYPDDSIVVCSFGDASLNHSTAQGSINAAANVAHQKLPLPLLLVCEDNGIGISVRTPAGWVAASLAGRSGLDYLQADTSDASHTAEMARRAVDIARNQRRPVVLHLRTVRYGGHAGTDVESAYRTADDIRGDYARDPLLGTAHHLVTVHGMTPDDVLSLYESTRTQVEDAIARIGDPPQLTDAATIVAPLAPRSPQLVADAVRAAGVASVEGLTLAQAINKTLDHEISTNGDIVVFGEDVAAKGGVYGVTRGLAKKHGALRIFDTILDEQSILGVALGAANAGLVPVPEIQYLAYLHNAEDQLRGEAATLQFFSQGAYRNGMVVRIAGYGYQKGFGGHFHNDNSVAVLRDIPGLVIASPSRADDAAGMLQTLIAAARIDGTVSAFLEPIALYHTAGLHTENDRGWLANGGQHIPIGRARLYVNDDEPDPDLLVVSYANGVPMSLRVARRLLTHGIRARVLDLRWLAPIPLSDILENAGCGRILVVDETRRSGGVSEGVVSELLDAGYRGRLARICSKDSFIPLGAAARHVLLSEEEILDAARQLMLD